ncbi:MAG: hypothetical protein ABI634_18275 [Acidobacteriota bacterium]
MAVSINKYGKAYANLLGGESSGDTFAVDFLSDTLKMALAGSGYTPDLDAHEVFSDVTSEVTGTGYTAGGATLGSKTITYTAANSWATARANSTAYVVGDIVRPAAGNGHLYRCIVAGTSHSSAPTFPTVSGQTVAEGSGTVVWAEIGRGLTQLDAADPSWTSATISGIRYAVIYKSTGTGSTSPLLWLIDFGADQAVTSGTFTAVFAALGIETFSTP